MTDEQLDSYLQLGMLALKDTTAKITRLIGTTDNMTHSIDLDIAANIDPKTLGGPASGPGSE